MSPVTRWRRRQPARDERRGARTILAPTEQGQFHDGVGPGVGVMRGKFESGARTGGQTVFRGYIRPLMPRASGSRAKAKSVGVNFDRDDVPRCGLEPKPAAHPEVRRGKGGAGRGGIEVGGHGTERKV